MSSQMDHVIVLMLENRSFDHMFGYLQHPNPKFKPLVGNESCPDALGNPVKVSSQARFEIQSPDHSHEGIMEQLKDNNHGFVKNYEKRSHGHGDQIMRCFHPEMIPVLTTLAREYAVCTRWHCSVPGETWPNRQFAHAATSNGQANIKFMKGFWLDDETIFHQVEAGGGTYRIYHDDTPHLWAYASLWDTRERRGRFRPIRKLYTAIAKDQLPSYSFVEPDYGLVGWGNSQHPSQAHTRGEFAAGERLIHKIYDTLRRNPKVFEKTVLVITYDEHGGFFDREPPPATVNPDGKKHGSFDFDRLGVRVPAVIVSPWIPSNTVDETLYDHTAIITTVRSRFAVGKPALSKRDKQANNFRFLLSLNEPRRGNELPVTHEFDNAVYAAIELQHGARNKAKGGLEADAAEAVMVPASDFVKAMRQLSEAVGEKLEKSEENQESTRGPEIDVGKPPEVLARFRQMFDRRRGVKGGGRALIQGVPAQSQACAGSIRTDEATLTGYLQTPIGRDTRLLVGRSTRGSRSKASRRESSRSGYPGHRAARGRVASRPCAGSSLATPMPRPFGPAPRHCPGRQRLGPRRPSGRRPGGATRATPGANTHTTHQRARSTRRPTSLASHTHTRAPWSSSLRRSSSRAGTWRPHAAATT